MLPESSAGLDEAAQCTFSWLRTPGGFAPRPADAAVENCTVLTTDLGEEGVELAKLDAYDIIFLDLDLPICPASGVQSLRTANVNTPILILPGLVATANKGKGLGFGADDYVPEPFHKDELLAHMQAVVAAGKERPKRWCDTGTWSSMWTQKRAEVAGQSVT